VREASVRILLQPARRSSGEFVATCKATQNSRIALLFRSIAVSAPWMHGRLYAFLYSCSSYACSSFSNSPFEQSGVKLYPPQDYSMSRSQSISVICCFHRERERKDSVIELAAAVAAAKRKARHETRSARPCLHGDEIYT
jgi:hypothetical protein